MVATVYTAVPLPSEGMGTGLHKTESKRVLSEPRDILSRNLKAAFKAGGHSARSVGEAIGISNKTVSNIVNGTGATQLDKLVAVAKHIRIPLWQLLCPSIEISQTNAIAMAEMIESLAKLPEFNRAQIRRDIKREQAMTKLGQEPEET